MAFKRWAFVLASGAFTLVVALWISRGVPSAANTKHTRIEDITHRRSALAPPPPSARKLVVAVVDGLGFDHAEKLETLAPLSRDGVLRPMTASFPTYSAAGITSMFTGLSPRESGVRVDDRVPGADGLDDVLSAARDGGVVVRVRARDFEPFLGLSRAPTRADAKTGRLRALVDLFDASSSPLPADESEPARGIQAIDIGDVDDESDTHGASSREARKRALHAGVLLQAIAATLDPDRDVLIAVSAHGRLPSGGHGGVEPEVTTAFLLAWGHGIKRGETLGPRLLRDVAPTLTMLMGVHTPSSSMGAPMIDLLDVSDSEAARRLAEPLDALTRFDCADTSSPPCGDVDGAREELSRSNPRPAEELMSALSSSLDDARDAADSRTAMRRLLAAGFLAIALIVGASFARPRAPNWWIVPVIVWAPYLAVLAAKSHAPTLSALPPGPAFDHDAAIAVLASVGATTFASLRHRLDLSDAVWLVALSAALVGCALAWAGADPSALPPPTAAAVALLAAPLAAAATLSGWAILAVERLRAQNPG